MLAPLYSCMKKSKKTQQRFRVWLVGLHSRDDLAAGGEEGNPVLLPIFFAVLKYLDQTSFLIKNGIYQVRNLVYTYGTSYSSTGLIFGETEEGGGGDERWD